MNIVRNMEAVFVAAVALACAASFATAKVNLPRASEPAVVQGEVATVVVTAKRLTMQEKARLGS